MKPTRFVVRLEYRDERDLDVPWKLFIREVLNTKGEDIPADIYNQLKRMSEQFQSYIEYEEIHKEEICSRCGGYHNNGCPDPYVF